ncbi:MAG: TIM barrel protein [Solirubrobacterales bacterium]|nr:TIM barrel protein [Solirubrobacterales bacterium]
MSARAGSKPPIANAPISYGVFGATGGAGRVSPLEMLAGIADAGYVGCELGPPGFFGGAGQTADAFAAAGLRAVAAYVPIHFTAGDDTVERELCGLRRSAEELVACGRDGLLILADEGSRALLKAPAHDPGDPRLSLDPNGWRRLAQITRDAVQIAAEFGLRCSFHPHVSTYVEHPSEIDRLLALTELSLTLDTGHLLLAGGDPLACLRAWSERVNHVHLKDVRVDVLRAAKATGRTDFDQWWADVSVPLGRGDVELAAFTAELLRRGYDGWLVVEQDRGPTPRERYDEVAEEQRANFEFVERLLEQGNRLH